MVIKMNSMIVYQGFFENLKVLTKSGRESIIYISDDYDNIYKVYKNSSFEKPSPEKIYQLFKKREHISKNILPDCLLFAFNEQGEKEFIGISMKYLKNYYTLDEINRMDEVDFKIIFLNLINSLKELTDNHVYPTDLNDKNILVSADFDVQIIDLDGEHCIISDKEEIDKLNVIFDRLLYHIYFHLMETSPEVYQNVRLNGYRILNQYEYDDEFIKMLEKEEPINYEKLINVVNNNFQRKSRLL